MSSLRRYGNDFDTLTHAIPTIYLVNDHAYKELPNGFNDATTYIIAHGDDIADYIFVGELTEKSLYDALECVNAPMQYYIIFSVTNDHVCNNGHLQGRILNVISYANDRIVIFNP